MATISASTVRPLADINNKPIICWTKDEVLTYALDIQNKLRGWDACVHNHPSGLVVTTTPDPSSSIRITDAAGKILFKNP